MQIVSIQYLLAIPVNSRTFPLMLENSHFPCVPSAFPSLFRIILIHLPPGSLLWKMSSAPAKTRGSFSGAFLIPCQPLHREYQLIYEHLLTHRSSCRIRSFTRIGISSVYHWIHRTEPRAWHTVGGQYLHKTECIRTVSMEAGLTNIFEESFLVECLLAFRNSKPIRDGQLG